jgi:DNA-binding response OmpR family regulator
MSAISSSSTVRFGRFEVNLQSGELRHAGQRVKLQEQPFQVLATLLDRPGEVVTRDELRSRLWPEDTFVDFDHGLNAAIKRLRDALGESAETLQCSSKRSLDVDIVSSLQSTAPLLQAQQRSQPRTEINQFSQLDGS